MKMTEVNLLRAYLIGFSSLFMVTLSQCQSGSNQPISNQVSDTLNLKDAQGLKQGLWIDTTKYQVIRHRNYVNDTLHGESKNYYLKTNILGLRGQYFKGQKAGTWYQYNRKDGKLLYEESQIGINSDVKVLNDGSPYVPPRISYIKFFDREKGYLESEGYILYTDFPLEDTSVDHGKWVYYDETGNIIRTEIYGAGLVVD